MKKIFGQLAGALVALALSSGLAAAQSKITIAVGGGSCLCYLPTVLAKQLGEYERILRARRSASARRARRRISS